MTKTCFLFLLTCGSVGRQFIICCPENTAFYKENCCDLEVPWYCSIQNATPWYHELVAFSIQNLQCSESTRANLYSETSQQEIQTHSVPLSRTSCWETGLKKELHQNTMLQPLFHLETESLVPKLHHLGKQNFLSQIKWGQIFFNVSMSYWTVSPWSFIM